MPSGAWVIGLVSGRRRETGTRPLLLGLIGEYQLVFQVSSDVTSGDDVPIVVKMGNRSDTATIAIQQRP